MSILPCRVGVDLIESYQKRISSSFSPLNTTAISSWKNRRVLYKIRDKHKKLHLHIIFFSSCYFINRQKKTKYVGREKDFFSLSCQLKSRDVSVSSTHTQQVDNQLKWDVIFQVVSIWKKKIKITAVLLFVGWGTLPSKQSNIGENQKKTAVKKWTEIIKRE